MLPKFIEKCIEKSDRYLNLTSDAVIGVGMVIKAAIVGIGERSINQNFNVILLIWKNQYPPENPRQHTILEKIVPTFPLIVRGLSLSNIAGAFESRWMKHNIRDIYLISWAIFLTVVLFIEWNPIIVIGELHILPFACLAFYRALDLLGYNLCILLIDTQKVEWQPASYRRLVLKAFVNIYELVISFSVIYISIGGIQNDGIPISDPLTAIYFSLVTMSTLGFGEFTPTTVISRVVVASHLIFELLFAFTIIPLFISSLSNKLGEGEYLE